MKPCYGLLLVGWNKMVHNYFYPRTPDNYFYPRSLSLSTKRHCVKQKTVAKNDEVIEISFVKTLEELLNGSSIMNEVLCCKRTLQSSLGQ